LGLIVDGDPYPAEIRFVAKAAGSKVRITGTTTSMRPLTALTVYVKDLTKKKARFVKQAKLALLNSQGGITWSGKAPSKRFAVYLSGGGAKSKTVTVTVR
jgi:YbbR domain-containing protein